MAIRVSVQNDDKSLPDIIVLTLCHKQWGAQLKSYVEVLFESANSPNSINVLFRSNSPGRCECSRCLDAFRFF